MNNIPKLDNRVYQILSQPAPKGAIDLLGMRIATEINNKSQLPDYPYQGINAVSYTHLTLPTICSV